MFSGLLEPESALAEKIGTFPPVDGGGFRSLLERAGAGERLETASVVELLNGTLDPKNRRILKEFAAGYRRPHDREILLLPPLYFSSLCENRCKYCDFSAGGLRLSLDEFSREMDALLETGYRSIELVCGQDPGLFRHETPFQGNEQSFRLPEVTSYFRLAKEKIRAAGGGMLTSNIPPVDTESFKDLQAAGLDCFLVWLETFHRGQYARLHAPGGPKYFQDFRLDSFVRAREAGISHLAGAFLKGLYDWRKEEVLLYALDRFLKDRYGRGFSIIGTPRLKGGFLDSDLVKGYVVSDEEYELNVALDRILFDGLLWLQTREAPAMNRALIRTYGAGVILTITCSTAPGGYHRKFPAKAQFPVHLQDLRRTIRSYEEEGYSVRFAWTPEMMAEFQRKPQSAGPAR
jgi:2-iminoacetate synthase